jgi:N-acetylmuramoyl-L-alanine amidase
MLIPSAAHGNSGTMINRSRNAGLAILDRVVTNTEAVNRGIVERADLSGFNWSEIPVVLLETGFMTNPQEDILLNSGGYQDKIVRGIYEGLIIYFRDRSQESLVQKNSHAGRFVD